MEDKHDLNHAVLVEKQDPKLPRCIAKMKIRDGCLGCHKDSINTIHKLNHNHKHQHQHQHQHKQRFSKMGEPDIPLAQATYMDSVPPPMAPGVAASAPPQAATAALQRTAHALTDSEIRSLQDQGFTLGLIESLQRNAAQLPLRIWVVDNSGSMSKADGKRMISPKNNKRDIRLVPCTRWTEIQETVDYHAQMARLLQAPTSFRLLNNPGVVGSKQFFGVGQRGPDLLDEDLQIVRQTMRDAQPRGVTPLASHVREIRRQITDMLPQLQQTGGKVVMVLATDGLPSDEMGISGETSRSELQVALRSLEGLPVWIVVRLCTDEDSVVEYYDDLDAHLERSLEVLDDFSGEAKQIHEHNSWLNYALPLHRMREMGFHHRLFDLLDERSLTLDEIRDFMFLLFGSGKLDGVEDPQVDFGSFCSSITQILRDESHQWNPATQRMEPWVDVRQLKKEFGHGGCTIL